MKTGARRNFRLLFVGQLISQFGDSIFHIGLLWLALDLTGSKSSTGIIAAAGYLPAVILSLAAGVVADRMDRRRLMMACAALQAFVVAAVPLLGYWGWLNGVSLAVVAFGLSAGASFFNPARDAMLPSLVPAKELTRANSWIQVSAQLAFLAGPAAAGLLIHWTGLLHLFTIDSATFLASLLTLWLIRQPRVVSPALRAGPSPLPQVPQAAGSTWQEIMDGLRLAWSDGRLRGLLFITAVDNLIIMGPAIVGMPIFVREVLGGDATDYAMIMAVLFAGMVSMSLLMGWKGERWPKGKLIALGMLLDGLTFLPLVWLQDLPLICLAMFIHGLTVPLLVVPRVTLVQQVVPDESRGRIFALLNLAIVGFTALSTALTGIAAEYLSMPNIYLIIGLAGAVCGAASLLMRDLRQAR
ncbi:MAG: MFS transporter [Deltaproteobacteria bacterium]|nr:MFS transporter [Deltaproteobacteria bacterium]